MRWLLVAVAQVVRVEAVVLVVMGHKVQIQVSLV
jgi:hypothetical protein